MKKILLARISIMLFLALGAGNAFAELNLLDILNSTEGGIYLNHYTEIPGTEFTFNPLSDTIKVLSSASIPN